MKSVSCGGFLYTPGDEDSAITPGRSQFFSVDVIDSSGTGLKNNFSFICLKVILLEVKFFK